MVVGFITTRAGMAWLQAIRAGSECSLAGLSTNGAASAYRYSASGYKNAANTRLALRRGGHFKISLGFSMGQFAAG